MKYPHLQQHDEKDCGAACLSMISEFYGAKYQISKLRNLIKVDNQGANIYGIVMGAKEIGLNAEALEGDMKELLDSISKREVEFPFIARIINELGFEHFIVVYNIKKDVVIVGDPGKSAISKISLNTFAEQWQRQLIIFKPDESFLKINERRGAFLKFFKYILSQKKFLSIVFGLSVIVTLINISGSIVLQYVIDAAVYDTFIEISGEDIDYEEDEQENKEEDVHEHEGESKFIVFLESVEEKLGIIFANINTVCISIIFLYFFQKVIEVLRGYILSLIVKKIDVSLTLNFYNHLTSLPVGFYGTRKTGEYMSRFNDVSKIREAVSSATLTIMLDTIMAIGCGILLITINIKLFIITCIVLITYGAIIYIFKRPIKNYNHILMEQDAQVTSYLKESIDGIETIKAYNYEVDAQMKTKNLYNKFAEKNVKASVLYNVMGSLVSLSESIGEIVLLWVGAALCIKNVISLTDLIIFYYLISYFLVPVKNLINLQPELQTAMVAAERLNDILDVTMEENTKEKPNTLFGDIEFNQVDFRYGNRELILKNVSLKFRKGQKTAIVGESGCGKTTLIKLLMSFYIPESGTITINDKDISCYSPSAVREKISYISQNIFLFSDTIYNNLRMGNEDISNEKVEEICRLCFADEFIKSLPLGYETVLEENGNNLSGGQKQRLAVARALLRNPEILIMDEATSNLDSITEKSIKATIDKLSSNMTCIIIAHRLNTIKNCDYIYVMDKGNVVEEGTHEQLLTKNGLYQNFNLSN